MKLDKQKEAIFYQAIGYNIRLARKQLRLTQKDLAFLTGLSRVSINNIENGKQRLPAHWISPICKLLGKNINDVIPIFEGEVKTLSELMESKLAKVQGKLLDTHFAGKPVQGTIDSNGMISGAEGVHESEPIVVYPYDKHFEEGRE